MTDQEKAAIDISLLVMQQKVEELSEEIKRIRMILWSKK